MATVSVCLHRACIHNINNQCTAKLVEIDEFLHCSSWEVNK